MIELLTGWLGALKNADHVGITTQIYELVKKTEVNNDMYKAGVAALAKAIAKEDEAYKKTQKDWAVEELKTVDAELDAYMKGIRSIVAGYAALPATVETTQMAKELLQLWKEYDFKLCNSYSAESAKVVNMFQEVEARRKDAETLGVWSLFEKARELAVQVQNLLGDRFKELGSRVVGELLAARAATDVAIKQLYMVVGSMQAFESGETVTAMARELRAIEDYARVYYLKMPSSSGDDTPTDTPDGTPDSGDTTPGGGSSSGNTPPPAGGGD